MDKFQEPQLPSWPKPKKPTRSGKVTGEAAARLPKSGLAATRTDLLDAAEQLVNEHVLDATQNSRPIDPLPFLDLDETLEVATEIARQRLMQEGRLLPHERVSPLTRGAFYKALSNLEGSEGGQSVAFRRLVAERLVQQADITAEPYIALSRELHDLGFDWPEVIRLGVKADINHRLETPAFIVMGALALHTNDTEIAERLRDRDERNIAALTDFYATTLPLYNRQMRPGLAVEHMAIAISDLAAGAALRSRFSSPNNERAIIQHTDGSEEKEWHVAAFAALAIYESFTETCEDREDH